MCVDDVGEEGARALAHAPALRCLKLKMCGVNPDSAAALTSALTAVTDLDLGGHEYLVDAGARFLTRLGGLRSLGLWDCQIKATGALSLTVLTALTQLNLSSNSVGDDSLCAIAASLTGLLSLDLDGVDITGRGAGALLSLTALTRLDLAQNGDLGSEGALAIQELTRLRCLELGGTSFDYGKLAGVLEALKGLEHLGLRNHGVHGEGTAALAALTALTWLDYNDKWNRATTLVALTRLRDLELATVRSAEDAAVLLGLPRLSCLVLRWQVREWEHVLAPLTALRRLKVHVIWDGESRCVVS
jgi:hypothetical protein